MKLPALLSMLLLVSAGAGYAGDKKAEIIGKWKDGETGHTVEYKQNGQFEETLPTGDVIHGRYSFVDQTRIFLRGASELIPIAPVIAPITINGDNMEIVGPDGKKPKKLKRKVDGAAGQ